MLSELRPFGTHPFSVIYYHNSDIQLLGTFATKEEAQGFQTILTLNKITTVILEIGKPLNLKYVDDGLVEHIPESSGSISIDDSESIERSDGKQKWD